MWVFSIQYWQYCNSIGRPICLQNDHKWKLLMLWLWGCYASSVFFPNDQYLFSSLQLLPPILSRGKAFPETHSSVSGCKCWLKGNVSLINIKPKVYAKHFLLRLFRILHYWVYFLWLLALKLSFSISLFYWALMCRTQHILYSPVMAFEV